MAEVRTATQGIEEKPSSMANLHHQHYSKKSSRGCDGGADDDDDGGEPPGLVRGKCQPGIVAYGDIVVEVSY